MYLYDLQSSQISGFGIQGSVNAPSGASEYGIRVRAMSHSTIGPGSSNGEFTEAAIKFDQAPIKSACLSVLAGNQGEGEAWVLPGDMSGLEMIQCNN